MISFVFFFLLIAFVINSLYFLHLVRKDHLQFYAEYKKWLWGAVVFLNVPILLRCLFDWLMEFPFMNDFILNPNTPSVTTTYNLLFFTLTTWTLIFGQISTLVFGLVRAK